MIRMWQIFLIYQATVAVRAVPVEPTPAYAPVCGYDSCNQHEADVLNVHIVPHSHDDVGWLKTVDQYYFGSRNNIQVAGVQYILDTVVKELWEDPKRRFIYVESFFFFKWWNRQTDDVKEKVRTLVAEGRLQFAGGAWSMNDEAAAHYHSTVDQFTHGLSKLNATFGPCGIPRVGWQIDPFGHSRELASLLAASGYDGLFLGRIDYQDKRTRISEDTKTMEMIWRGDDSLGKQSDIFTGVLYNTYSPPAGFCFDIMCSDRPIVDDTHSPDYNVEERVTEFLQVIAKMSESYRSNNILVTMGDDFQYQDARTWFINLDKLIQSGSSFYCLYKRTLSHHHLTPIKKPELPYELNVGLFLQEIAEQIRHYRSNNILMTMGGDFQYQDANTWFRNLDLLIAHTNLIAGKEGIKIKLFYSTPQCYLKAVKDANQTFPTKRDDFFPYASDPHAYWTGYFTSRPTTKYFERLANTYLQMAKHLQVLGDLKKSNIYVLNELKSAMGIMQHHDAITGTEKQHVANDYERILTNAIEDALVIPQEAFSKFMLGESVAPRLSFASCRFNESSCAESENNEQFVVTLYNHLAWHINESVRIPVAKDQNWEVYAPDGEKIPSQLVQIPEAVLNIPTRLSKATNEIVFIAHLKPLSYKNFYIQKGPEKHTARERRAKNIKGVDKEKDFNVNEYFTKIKENSNIEIKTLEAKPLKEVENHVLKEKIPDPPVNKVHIGSDSYNYETLNVDVMRDAKNNHYNRDGQEMDRIVNEARRQLRKSQSGPPDAPRGGQWAPLSEDEARMLSDGPQVVERAGRDMRWHTQNLRVDFDSASGKLGVTSADGISTKIDINFGYYIGTKGRNQNFTDRASGAYIFRPTSFYPEKINLQVNASTDGDIVKEMSLNSYDNIASIVRIYEGLNFIEHDWVVGPIDISDNEGKEYVVDYNTPLKNNKEFYTDSNGRQLIKRVLNERKQWNVSLAEPVAGNYYPITNQIVIEDNEKRFSVLTDRSEGGSSLQEGQIEIMLHRRLLFDDAFGVGEALNETVLNGTGLVVRGRHRLLLGANNKQQKINEKKLVKQFDLQPQIFVSNAKDLTLNEWLKMKNCFSFANELPEGLHLLTLEPWDEKLLIRLENYLEITDREMSTVEIDLNSIFTTINIKSYKETTLAANRWIEDLDHWSWKKETDFDEIPNDSADKNDSMDSLTVVIKARQIRTFVVDYEFK